MYSTQPAFRAANYWYLHCIYTAYVQMHFVVVQQHHMMWSLTASYDSYLEHRWSSINRLVCSFTTSTRLDRAVEPRRFGSGTSLEVNHFADFEMGLQQPVPLCGYSLVARSNSTICYPWFGSSNLNLKADNRNVTSRRVTQYAPE